MCVQAERGVRPVFRIEARRFERSGGARASDIFQDGGAGGGA